MASTQLYKDFYALLKSPYSEELPDHEISNLPRDPDSSGDAPDRQAIRLRVRSYEQANRICNGLFTQFNIDPSPPLSVPGFDRDVAYLLVRSELEQTLCSDELPRRTKDELEERLNEYMRLEDSVGSRVSREEAVATQDPLLLKSSLTFEDLPKIFLPGDIVYTADPTLVKDTFYEQCWMVVSCELSTEGLLIEVKKWRFDATSYNG
ncbi:hypothetical protein CKAH01_17641 [Colletotrichum kahawae]|uniref:Uncharacterized protein n=1 Tax=Colletotrichum kahawae TaxID=34407 RepID=A0AAE0D4C0_COLKA|nr:hypothetical protein CKAH01_17641 [Colletotrichum kahawae]